MPYLPVESAPLRVALSTVLLTQDGTERRWTASCWDMPLLLHSYTDWFYMYIPGEYLKNKRENLLLMREKRKQHFLVIICFTFFLIFFFLIIFIQLIRYKQLFVSLLYEFHFIRRAYAYTFVFFNHRYKYRVHEKLVYIFFFFNTAISHIRRVGLQLTSYEQFEKLCLFLQKR